MSFVQKALSKNGHRLYYIRATADDGLLAWYFVFVSPSKEDAFKKLDTSKPYNIGDYGDIIDSGYGEFAPQSVISEMNEKYNCNFSN